MYKTNKLTVVLFLLAAIVLFGACDTLRFAPMESQKQNTYLHHRTIVAAATRAQDEQSSQTLQQLTSNAAQQSDAILAYYGLPKNLPSTESIDAILSEENKKITEQAHAAALQRPNPWDVADHLMELGIALAGVVGGVYGTRAIGALKAAKEKSTALREIIKGNELFKQDNPESTNSFKKSHQIQNETTRSIVTEMKGQ